MKLIIERFAHNALALLAVTTILFFMFRLMPGTPLAAVLNETLNADQQQRMPAQFGLDKPMRAIQAVLQWLPWPAVMLLVGVTGLRAGGWKPALFAVASPARPVTVDYRTQSMSSLPLGRLAGPLHGVGAVAAAARRTYLWRVDRVDSHVAGLWRVASG